MARIPQGPIRTFSDSSVPRVQDQRVPAMGVTARGQQARAKPAPVHPLLPQIQRQTQEGDKGSSNTQTLTHVEVQESDKMSESRPGDTGEGQRKSRGNRQSSRGLRTPSSGQRLAPPGQMPRHTSRSVSVPDLSYDLSFSDEDEEDDDYDTPGFINFRYGYRQEYRPQVYIQEEQEEVSYRQGPWEERYQDPGGHGWQYGGGQGEGYEEPWEEYQDNYSRVLETVPEEEEEEEVHPRTCPCNIVTAMTACKLGQEHVVRIERVPRDQIEAAHAHHVADGPFRGIVINKSPETGLPEVGTANILMEFTACLYGKNQINGERREKRQLKFWFRRPADRRQQAACSRDYFRSLLEPEDFPKDYVNFIKKAILLSQSYPLIRRVDIVLQPAAPSPSPPDSEEEEPYPPPSRGSSCLPHLHPPICTSTPRPPGSQDSSGDQPDGVEDSGPVENYITVITPAVYDYQYLPEIKVARRSFIGFRVRARADAHIALSNVYGNTEERTYEIVIGGWNNTSSFIKDGAQGPILAEAVTMRTLSNLEYRDFWVSWAEGIIQVGEGKQPGMNIFLRWDIPPKKLFSINALSVSTAASSDGAWEFVENLDQMTQEEEKARQKRKEKIRTSLLWASKKQKMLTVLEDVYPNSLDTTSLLKLSNINLRDMMPAVVFLKEMQGKGLLTEIRRGLWMRAPRNRKDKDHEVRIVLDLPRLPAKETPTVALVTTLFCEKLAVDAMIENKVSYVKYKVDGESTVYTVGRIGDRTVVAVKLAKTGDTPRATAISTGNQITRLIGVFNRIEHVIIVGVGGAVPHYSDHRKHVRLGDVVVSVPKRNSRDPAPIYVHCDKIIHDKVKDRFKFRNRQWTMRPDHPIPVLVHQMRQLHEAEGLSLQPWEILTQEAADNLLDDEEMSFRRPQPKTDRLFAQVEGEMVEVEHPRPRRRNPRAENRTTIRYGPVGSGKYIPTNQRLRHEFANQTEVIAYDGGFAPVLESLRGSKCESFLVIRGMSDYADGTANKEWQPYAALSAAAYMKTLVAALPKSSLLTLYQRK